MAAALIIPGSFLGMITALVQLIMLNASVWQSTQSYFLVALSFALAGVVANLARRLARPMARSENGLAAQ